MGDKKPLILTEEFKIALHKLFEVKRYVYIIREDWHGVICVSETIRGGLLWAIKHGYLADVIIEDNGEELTVRQIIEKRANRKLTDGELAEYITEMDDRNNFLDGIISIEKVELV